MTKEERDVFLKDVHERYHQRARILRRLEKASIKGLSRFADAIEVLSDEDLDLIALECERIAQEKMKALLDHAETSVFQRQPDENGEQEQNEEI